MDAIRDAALSLLAAPNGGRVTIREVAAAAGVSPALVIRKFGSRDGLLDAVDEHVTQLIDAVLASVLEERGHATRPESVAGSLISMLPQDSPVGRYLARMAVDGGARSQVLFARIFAAGRATLDALVTAGAATPGSDPTARAVVLTASDLAVVLLADRIAEALGEHPLSEPGALRYSSAVAELHRDGLGKASS